MRYCLAIDIGASSGRHIVGWQEDGELRTQEVYRFPNGAKESDGRLIWDMESMFESVAQGIAARVGGQCQAVLCATHDTASAVEGIPMEGSQLYISSGTWSLLGVKTPRPLTDAGSEAANYSNEGGVGCNRYQKNIMGLWLVQRLQKELCPDKDFGTIAQEAAESSFQGSVDANAQDFLAPASMKEAIESYLRQRGQALPACERDYFCCAFRSLALGYRQAIEELERNVGRSYERLYIVGGGARNRFLNTLTAQATGKDIIALPIEATALGNLRVQMAALS
jgi:rhamnulokinase